MKLVTVAVLDILISLLVLSHSAWGRKPSRKSRQAHTVVHTNVTYELDPMSNSVDPDLIWSTTTVAVGDTAVLHCSFDAIFSQLRNGNIDWVRESNGKSKDGKSEKAELVATGKKVAIQEKRYRVFRPHNSALSVLIIRRSKKRDAGVYRCNLSGSSTRHKYMILNVTESKIEAQTSPAKIKARMNKDVTLWCNATGYPKPIVYWTREDRNRRLPDGTYQYWGNGLKIERATEAETGIYACYLDNFVQPVVSYKFSLIVEDRPWNIDAFKMRFDSSQWYDHKGDEPRPVIGKTFLLMCETKGAPKPLPEIRWFFNSKEITNNRYYYIIDDKPEWRNSYASSTLVIKTFETTMEGEYTCVASNVFRIKKKTIEVKGSLKIDEVVNILTENNTPEPITTADPSKTYPLNLPSNVKHPLADSQNQPTTTNQQTSNYRKLAKAVFDKNSFNMEVENTNSFDDDEDLNNRLESSGNG